MESSARWRKDRSGGILLEGLRRLEYRGYDSAGVALLDPELGLRCIKRAGKVAALSASLELEPLLGVTGIAHTRWATHGRPSEVNAHPQLSADRLALVHNGIIENHERLRERLRKAGYEFVSETDTEVIVHLIDSLRCKRPLAARGREGIHSRSSRARLR